MIVSISLTGLRDRKQAEVSGGPMTHVHIDTEGDLYPVHYAPGSSPIVLVCEHASNHIPEAYRGLGLSEADRVSHAAWDPGALAVAEGMARHLDASLVAALVSRLVIDCNRPPEASDAMPARSEVIAVPGNIGLTPRDRAARAAAYYHPFHATVERALERVSEPILVTIHSFTPTYHGTARPVEIGILHDRDTRLADAMLDLAERRTDAVVARNQPYGPEDGVTHTLQRHAVEAGRPNVMIEVRNDLLATPAQQESMALTLSQWLAEACATLGLAEGVQCRA